jgi:hypothetical protein
MYYGITEQSVISRHRIVVSRPLGGRGSCALAAAFAAAFAASFTTWFETGQTCDYCDCTIQSFSPREYITTGSYWVAMGYNHSTLTSENDHCCSPTVESWVGTESMSFISGLFVLIFDIWLDRACIRYSGIWTVYRSCIVTCYKYN